METRNYISEELFQKMKEALTKNDDTFCDFSSDVTVLLTVPKTLSKFTVSKKVFRIRVKDNWFSVDAKRLKSLSYAILNKRLNRTILAAEDAPDEIIAFCE